MPELLSNNRQHRKGSHGLAQPARPAADPRPDRLSEMFTPSS
jgi:hypothetical protein